MDMLGDHPTGQVLAVGAGLMAVSYVFGQLFGEVADAAGGAAGSRKDALGVEPRAEPGDVQRFGLWADGVEHVAPGGQELPGGWVDEPAGWFVPDQQRVVDAADGGGGSPPDLVVGGGQDQASVQGADGLAPFAASSAFMDFKRSPTGGVLSRGFSFPYHSSRSQSN
jgi:hypothetical protein